MSKLIRKNRKAKKVAPISNLYSYHEIIHLVRDKIPEAQAIGNVSWYGTYDNFFDKPPLGIPKRVITFHIMYHRRRVEYDVIPGILRVIVASGDDERWDTEEAIALTKRLRGRWCPKR